MTTPRDYTTLSLAQVRHDLDEIAREARATFGQLDARQLNWQPDPTRWSVGQCFEHLLTANRMMLQAAEKALDRTQPRSFWQRVPKLPGWLGRALIRSQSPQTTRKFKAPPQAQPAASNISSDILARFLDQQGSALEQAEELNEQTAARTIMTSPFLRVITYSVLDGWRLLVTHEWRHLEQARRVTQTPGFPESQ